MFVPLDRPTADKNAEQQTDDKSALKPKMLKIPGEPSESERRLHELTHLLTVTGVSTVSSRRDDRVMP